MERKKSTKKRLSRRQILKYGLFGGLSAGLSGSIWLSSCRKLRQWRRPNVILIILDTVRADSLHVLVGQRSLTPNIDDVSRRGTAFVNAFTPAPWTLPSHAFMFTGHYAHKHNAIHEHFLLNNRFQTMAEILKSLRYVTGGFTCNPWLSPQNGMAQGFDTYEEVYKKLTRLKTDQGAAKTTEMVVKWLNQRANDKRPFFLFVNYMEAHLPYKPPARILHCLDSTKNRSRVPSFSSFSLKQAELYILGRNKLTRDELTRVKILYYAEIAYLDEQIGTIISCLRTLGFLDNTILIITSDHGENLGEHSLMGHEFSLFNTVLHIPLIVCYPAAVSQGESIDDPVSLVDILPTILEILGEHGRLVKLKGVSLLQARNIRSSGGRGILAEYSRPKTLLNHYWRSKHPQVDLSRYDVSLKALLKGQFKYVVSSRGEEFLYDVFEDTTEQTDVSGSFPEELSRLRAELTELSPTVAPIKNNSEMFTPEQRKQLESLGYL